jgi:hypothetical protein
VLIVAAVVGVIVVAIAVAVWAIRGREAVALASLSSRPSVAVIGDSLTKASTDEIAEQLRTAGYEPVRVDGINGMEIHRRIPELIEVSDGGDGAEIVVAALGTNNAFFSTVTDLRRREMATSLIDLDRAVTLVQQGGDGAPAPRSTRCLVWVTVKDSTDRSGLRTGAPPINAAVAARVETENAEGRPMRIADWAAAATDHPEYFVADEVHLTDEGQQAYARNIRTAVESCARTE